jgi:hypothetical protein
VKWDKLEQYIDADAKVFPVNDSMNWEKIFYLSAVKSDNGTFHLPEKNVPTVWEENKNCIYWKEIDVDEKTKSILERVKSCLDRINANGVKQYLGEIKAQIRNNRSVWLYYLLERKYSDLLMNDIIQDDYGIYQKKSTNYWEYVLKRDLEEKKCKIQEGSWRTWKQWGLLDALVSPRENDGFSNKKNMSVELHSTYCVKGDGYFYLRKDDNSILRYKYDSIQKSSAEDMFSVEEDMFSVEEDKTSLEWIEKNWKDNVSAISNQLDTYNEDDYYNWVFRGYCAGLQDDIKNLGFDVSCTKSGQKTIIIEIFMARPFQSTERRLLTHDNILDKFKRT